MLAGVIASTLSSWEFATPSEQYVDWGNKINFISMRDQNSPPPMNKYDIFCVSENVGMAFQFMAFKKWGIS